MTHRQRTPEQIEECKRNGISKDTYFARRELGWSAERACSEKTWGHERANQRLCAVYKGEELLADGTVEEVAKVLGIKENTLMFYGSPAYKRRIANSENSRELVWLDDDDEWED